MKAPDGEADAVVSPLPVDIPLARGARRASILRGNQLAVSDYGNFTQNPLGFSLAAGKPVRHG